MAVIVLCLFLQIDSNSIYERKKWTKVLREDLCNEIAAPERRFYVDFPNSNDHHHSVVVKVIMCKLYILACL